MKQMLKIASLLLLASCAQIVVPGGGEKDEIPPMVLSYTPDSAALNFKSRSIEILFDEYIVLSDINNQLLISPPFEHLPETTVKGKMLIINFDEKEVLKENTTYSFNFGNGVKDLNESNPKEDFRYLFSTGSFIDSLTVTGNVKNAFDHKTEKGLLVLLYSDFGDSAVFNNLPNYFAKTKEDGSFQINNIREGKYKIYALKDENSNYKYDENEKVAFFVDTIDAIETEPVQLEMFTEPIKKLYIKKRIHSSYGKIQFIFNKSTDSIQIIPIHDTLNDNDIVLDFSKNKDSLTYWFKNFDKDSLTLQVNHGSVILDTLEFKLKGKEKSLKNNRNPLRFNLLNSPDGNQRFDLNATVNLLFNNPIDTIHADTTITLLIDSVLYTGNDLTFQYKQGKRNALAMNNSFNFKESTACDMMIPAGAFTDIFGLKSDTLHVRFKTRESKYYGTVKLKINIADSTQKATGNYIVQLLSQKERLVREKIIINGETINYEYLHPNQYILKIIVDENNNGKWDTGNVLEKLQPEKVIYYTEPVNIRSNWDLDLEWKYQEKK